MVFPVLLASQTLLLVVTMTLRGCLFAFMVMLVAGCASGPKFSTTDADASLLPEQIAAKPELATGQRVVWGGVIMSSTNLTEKTQLEVLAYPLSDSSQRPQTDEAAKGRFLVIKSGYLEPVDYAQGRLITVSGRLDGTENGKIGEATYRYPKVLAEDIHLWSRESESSGGIPVRFGIGVIFHN
jgi:outer membrane lipoprotein